METQRLFATFIDERTTSLIGRIEKAARRSWGAMRVFNIKCWPAGLR
ncbi:hypothetical protein [Fibrella forsythiae]|uniref:Uncharacterized protein n=1 Tax=Fibrella forsythiae TaxID=2817061 RepID=A0ABS3JP75_9BACT|nr:hypothetical protein [Fibrella forsythiae]MBO0951806.1 hypothetical protein [Fibrella forsythiae]